jgi:hypothetical protein
MNGTESFSPALAPLCVPLQPAASYRCGRYSLCAQASKDFLRHSAGGGCRSSRCWSMGRAGKAESESGGAPRSFIAFVFFFLQIFRG